MAPYREAERENHKALCRILGERFGIRLALEDLLGEFADDVGTLDSVNPPGCVRVQGRDHLMIDTCTDSFLKGGEASPDFRIVPPTVEFQLIESIGGEGYA